jgi:hypothetical protein
MKLSFHLVRANKREILSQERRMGMNQHITTEQLSALSYHQKLSLMSKFGLVVDGDDEMCEAINVDSMIQVLLKEETSCDLLWGFIVNIL